MWKPVVKRRDNPHHPTPTRPHPQTSFTLLDPTRIIVHPIIIVLQEPGTKEFMLHADTHWVELDGSRNRGAEFVMDWKVPTH